LNTLDRKLENLRSNPDAKDFIIADAKDADMVLSDPALSYAN
jgi:hypothetical protein